MTLFWNVVRFERYFNADWSIEVYRVPQYNYRALNIFIKTSSDSLSPKNNMPAYAIAYGILKDSHRWVDIRKVLKQHRAKGDVVSMVVGSKCRVFISRRIWFFQSSLKWKFLGKFFKTLKRARGSERSLIQDRGLCFDKGKFEFEPIPLDLSNFTGPI